MNIKRIAISVEGKTEEAFVKKVLSKHLEQFHIYITPITIETSRDANGKKHTGGSIYLDRVVKDISKLQKNYSYVTTFYDFYGFENPNNYTVDELEAEIHKKFDNSIKIVPYIQKYEFETLLFAKPSYFKDYFNNIEVEKEINSILSKFNNKIENINNSKETAPSKRIQEIFEIYGKNNNKTYNKVLHGIDIIEKIGIDHLKKSLPRFKNWLEKIEKLNLE